MLIYHLDFETYLAGSVHFLPKNNPEIPPQLLDIYKRTSSLVLECIVENYDGALRRLPEGDSLPQIISPNCYNELMTKAQHIWNEDLPELDRLKPWACVLETSSRILEAAGLSHASGIDSYFKQRAEQDQKNIYELEPVDTVDRIFDATPSDQQEHYLLSFLQDIDNISSHTNELIQAWRAGDAVAIESKWLSRMPFRRSLITARNRFWADGIAKGCRTNPGALILVGVTHLVGPGNLLRALRSQGIHFHRLT
jgi:uncharacterized protein